MKTRPSPSLSVWTPLLSALALLLLIVWLMRPADDTVRLAMNASEVAAPARGVGGRKIMQRDRRRIADVDMREAGGAGESTESRARALDELRREIPGVQVDFDAITGAPKHIMAAGKFLVAGKGESGDPHAPVREFVEKHAALFGHDAADLARGRARVTREDVTAHNGMRTVVWQQEVAGVGVFEGILRANLTKNGDLITLGSHFMADAPRAAEKQIALVPGPPLNAARALAAAAVSLGGVLDLAQVTSQAAPQGLELAQKLEAPGFTDTTAHLAWVPVDEGTLRLAWQIETFSLQQNEMFRMLIDAEDGGVLVRQSLTADISDATYRVWTSDSPTPFTPGHNTPLPTQPAQVARTLLATQALDTTASPDGWIPDGQNETVGNNVDAHLDLNADNVADTPRPQGTSRVFDFTFNAASEPTTYRDASVTQLFYYNNWIHDRMYQLGFTESAGNFQTNNFGKGGNGNDAVQADAQDGSGTNNANFSTPSDGSPGRMQMYVWAGPAPDRDSSFDGDIVVHEYGHGVSNRLVGGGVGISAWQSRGMGEGWSDFYAMSLLSEAGDNVDGVYAMGGYSTYLLSGMSTNYYFGIRRHPYCTDMTKAPLTFKDIDPTQALPHTGVPLSPRYSASNADPSQYHAQGEVWCNMLLECRANIINHHGWAVGNELMLRIVTDGLKLTPANPTFIQARDAILQADLVNNAGANRMRLWAGLAKRGMGAAASAPVNSTTTGVVESFELPDDLGVTPTSTFAATGTINGPFTPASRVFTLQNSGAAALNWTASANQPWLSLSGTAGALATGASTTVTASFNTAANTLTAGAYSAAVTFTNTTSGAVITRIVSLTVDPLRITILSEPFDSATLGSAWTVTGTSTFRTQVTALNGPRASNHLTMDSSVDNSYARNEATLTVNLAGRSDVVLSFWAKSFADEANGPPTSPFINGADFDGVAVSADGGTTWWEVQPLRSLTATWTKYTVDLDAAIAARGISYGASFKIRFNQYDNYGIATDGIAIDDILVAQTLNNNLALALPASAVTEGASDMTATLTISPVQAAALTVNLDASRADVTVPASVVVPAGATLATFPVTIVDDALLDGSQPVTITATAPTFNTASTTLMVDDNETAVLALDAPLNGNEGSSSLAATVSVSAPVDVDVTVRLDTSNPQAGIPASVTIPAGQSSAEFYITLVNDALINGTRSATFTASLTGWTAGTDTISILDDETATVALVLDDTTNEGLAGTPQIGTLTLGGVAVTPVEVTLISGDTSELTLPATITIAAGQSSAALLATVIDDADLDGTQTVTVSAAAFGDAAVTDTIDVRDDDAASFVIGAVASPQREMQTFPLTITARDVNGALVPAVAGPWTLSAAGDGGAAVLNAPAAAFVNGVWQQNVSVTAPDTNVRITVTGPNATAQSNAFDVTIGPRIVVVPAAFTLDIPRQSSKTRALTITNNGLGSMTWSAAGTQSWLTCAPASGSVAQGQSAAVTLTFNAATLAEGSATAQLNVTSNDPITPAVAVPVTLNVTAPVASFAWDSVPSPQRANVPFPVTVTAKDAGGSTVTNFEGTAGISTIDVMGSSTIENQTSAGSIVAGGPIHVPFRVHRQQTIFLPAEVGPAGTITRVALRIASVPTVALTNFTIRLKHTALATASGWEGSGWTTCYQAATTINATSWFYFDLTTPFTYDGTSNLMIDFSFANAVVGSGTCYLTSSSGTRGVYSAADNPGTDPLTWTGTTPSVTLSTNLPAVRFVKTTFGGPGTVAPSTTGVFAGGVWNGDVRIPTTTPDVNLVATLSAPSTATGQSNSFAVNADGALGITLASQVIEGAGTLGGTVTITPAPTADVVVTLSSSVAGAAVPASPTVTVPAGNTSAPFTLNIIDDAVLDGPQTTQIGAVGAGYVAVSTPLVVADDEGAALTINLAQSSYAEGAGVISGTITSDNAPVVPVTIALTSSDTTEATVPASVTLAAGATTVAFSVTIINDTLVDGDQNLVLTAAVAGWTSGTKNLTVTDNEARTLTFTGVPASISEGAATLVTPSVVLTGQAVAPVVVTLTSSDVTALPTISVTIPAGASSAVFDLDPVDDTLFDGTQNVTLTASAATFSDGTAGVAVLDDDVHHFALSAVPSPQKEGAGFAFTTTAKDINDVTITAHVGGPVNLAAAGDGGALSVLPPVLTPFTSGVWTGQVRVMAPDTNVRLTVTSPTTSNQSNAFDVGMGPRLGVNPASYAVSVAQNTTKTRPLTLGNTGAEPLNWSATTTGDIEPALATVLAGINARYAEITALIPNRFDFSEGETGTTISDGGGAHMYHSGNYLSTALAASNYIPYNDNAIVADTVRFGSGGQYFTRKVPGLFVLAADMSGVSSFTISGNTGNHTGLVEGSTLTATRGAKTYKGFIKRARGDVSWGAESINHLIIIENDAAASHSWPATVDSDNHVLAGIGARSRLYYLLYSSVSGGNINDTVTQSIFDKFLDVIGTGSWMTVTPSSGTVAAGSSQSVSVDFNAGSLNTGLYNGGISITSNDALTSPLAIPATMTVTPGTHHFEWDALPSPQQVNAPISATIRARDVANGLVTDFEGTAALTALNTTSAGEATTGTGTSSTYLIHDTSYPVHRTQCIYTPAEAGSAGRLSGLALDVATLGSPAASNFTIRLKHTSRVNYATDTSWEGSGWSTVFTGSKSLAAGLNYFTFTAPFDYDGTSNLMVDFSFVNTAYSNSSNCRYSTASASRTIYYGAYSGDPLSWSGTSTYADSTTALPNLRLVKSGAPAPVSPLVTGAFVNGVWTGNIRLGAAGTVAVTATTAGATGTSNSVTTTTAAGALTLTLPASLSEGQGTLSNAGTVSVSSPPASPLTITLESLDTSEITLPASVTLPAGQSSVSFDVSVVDDSLLDGPVVVQNRALAVGYPTVSATSTVADNETTTVTLTLPASMTEVYSSTATAQGTVSLATAAAANLTLHLASSLSTRLTVPAIVTIPAGQSSAFFTLSLPDNSIIDGNQTATITATLTGSPPATGTVQVIDNETTNLVLYLYYSSVGEGGTPLTSGGYVYLSGSVTSALTINLASSDTTELTVPVTITIPAGSSQSSSFTLTPVNDTLQDGSQTVSVTASATGFTNSTKMITVLDDDLHHFTVSTVASPQVKNGPFSATFTAKDINNLTISTYTGTPSLTAADGVTPLTVTPASLTGFSSGVKTQSVTVGGFATSAVLTLTDSVTSGSGSSNAFAVGAGSLHHFAWDAISSPHSPATPFNVGIKARDAYENAVTSYAGVTQLTAAKNYSVTTAGTGTTGDWYPFGGYYPQNRCQMIYTPAEAGGVARKLQALAFDMTTPTASYPAVTLTNFTIRLKHTTKTDYNTSAVWETADWTTVYQGTVNMNQTGWRQFNFTTPFDYNGTDRLMVDISSSQAGFVNRIEARYSFVSPYRVLYSFTSSVTPPTQWTGAASAYPYLPNLRLVSFDPVVVTPPQTTAFTGGAWDGAISLNTPGSIIAMATDAATGVSGISNAFTVSSLGTLGLSHPLSSVSESGGIVTATLTLSTAPATDLVVSLTSSKPTAATVPASATIPAGQTSVTFPITVVNDALLEGTQTTLIAASLAGYDGSTASLTVLDDETTTVTLTLPGSISEGATSTAGQASVQITGAAGVDLTLTLASSDSVRLTLPATVTIPTGQSSVGFTLTAPNNSTIDPDPAVTITATLSGFAPATGTVQVVDNESRIITLYASSSVSEGAAPISSGGYVYLPSNVSSTLTVNLTSSDTTELTVPASVSFAAGTSGYRYFTLTPVNDNLADGSQSVTLTASAANFTSVTRNLTVLDDDLHHFGVSSVGSQVRNMLFNVTFTAYDAGNNVITTYAGTPALTAVDGGVALAVSPATVSGFVSGVRTQSIMVGSFASAAVLTLTDSVTGGSVSSNAFAVSYGTHAKFGWSTIASPQAAGVPVNATITAQDAYGNTNTDFNQTASLTAEGAVNVGAAITNNHFPLLAANHDARTQIIYTAAELGGAKTLTSLSYRILTLASQPLNAFTIRLKHTAKSDFAGGGAVWETTGWTTCHQSTQTIGAGGWHLFHFTTPFAYDGVQNLMMDISFNNSSSGTSANVVGTSAGAYRLMSQGANSTYGDPLTWSGTTPSPYSDYFRPDIRLGFESGLNLSPGVTGSFTAGVWTGDITFPASVSNVQIKAANGSISGLSNAFSVQASAPTPVIAVEPLFTGGLSNEIAWTLTPGGAEVSMERDVSPAFTAPVAVPWSTLGAHTFTGLADGSAYHYRARSRMADAPPSVQSWTQTTQADFQTGTLVSADAASLPGAVRLAQSTGFTESFEGAAADWSDTIFTNRTSAGYSKGSALGSLPVTTPQLPISADADKEGEMTGALAYAMMAETPGNTFTDCSITAYVYQRNITTLNHAGVLARITGSGATRNGYQARLHYNATAGLPVWMAVTKFTNGVESTLIPAGAGASFNPATEHFKVQLSITGVNIVARLWKMSVSGGAVTETLADTRSGSDSSFSSGVCGLSVSSGAVFENVVIAGTSYAPSGTITSPVITPASLGRWSTLGHTRLTPAGTTATVDVLNAAGSLLAANVASGADLNTLPAVASQPSLRLRANLATTNPSMTPELQDWTVAYFPPASFVYSPWSNVVTSTQDATPPSLAAPALATSSASGTLNGTATDATSGVASVSVAGNAATTANGFANWTSSVIGLANGANSFTVTASDNAMPPNTATVTAIVFRIATPSADADGDGVSDLMRHALAIPALAANARSMLPTASVQTDGGTGQRFFTLDYRRRIQRAGLTYAVETTSDLTNWTSTGGDIVEQSVTPVGDGFSETVRVRITPALDLASAKFVRLKVRIE